MASCPRFQSRFVLFGDRKSYTGHGPCLYLRPSTNLRKISGVIHDALGRHDDARAFELEVDALVPVTPPVYFVKSVFRV